MLILPGSVQFFHSKVLLGMFANRLSGWMSVPVAGPWTLFGGTVQYPRRSPELVHSSLVVERLKDQAVASLVTSRAFLRLSIRGRRSKPGLSRSRQGKGFQVGIRPGSTEASSRIEPDRITQISGFVKDAKTTTIK